MKRLPRGKGQIWSSAIISSRADLDNSLFVESRTEASHTDTIQNTEPSPDSRDTNTTVRSSSYMFLLSIVSGSIIKDMSDGITEIGYKAFDQLTSVSTEPVFEDWNDLGFEAQQDYPTISSVAQSKMEKKGIRLDSIQYVAYEIICASFLLNLLEEKWAVSSQCDNFGASDTERRSGVVNDARNRIRAKLKDMGAENPLRMFVTGPAGAGKRHCYKCGKAVLP